MVGDRANDNWRALFTVADAAGGDWLDRARTAARLLADTVGHEASSVGEMLIADVHKVFTGSQSEGQIERLSSVDLTGRLVQMEGRPWAEWKGGKPLSPNALARQLKNFKITPTTMRLDGGAVLKGYRYQDFVSVFESYGLPATVTPLQSNNDGHSSHIQTVTPAADVTVAKSRKPNNDGLCNVVTVAAPETEDATWTV
jgi:putative DNA primase/helicase